MPHKKGSRKPDRDAEIRRLRREHDTSMTKLGTQYGVSRQRIHQILRRTGHGRQA